MPILDICGEDPRSDGRQSELALSVRRGVVRQFREMGSCMIAELPLANGRRADLIGIDSKGRFTIVEIKSSVSDFRADRKWPDYLEFCDRFYFATHADVPQELFPDEHGLIVADDYGAEIIRPAMEGLIAPARRKALTLRFARVAADRLERALVYGEAAGEAVPAEMLESADDG